MDLEVSGNIIKIKSPIITIDDAHQLINTIKSISSMHNQIILDLKNTFSFPSNVIGLLEKLKDEGKHIKIIVYDDVIYELFKDLNLDKSFNILKA